MRTQKVFAFARAEIQLTRRLVRYWFFLSVSYLVAIIFFLLYTGFYGMYSSYSATAALSNPSQVVDTIGLYYLFIYVAGTVFLGFDVRTRDKKDGIIEVLDSRPYTNLELVTGRFLGLLISSWLPVVLLAVILEFLGVLLVNLGTPFGGTIEFRSLFAFVFIMALPALAFILSLVYLVTLLIRNRLLAAVILLILLGGDFWAISNLPSIYSPLIDLTGTTIIQNPSEIIPAVTNMAGWLQRLGVFLAALGMLGLSAAFHPRLDGGARKRTASVGIAVIVLALLMTGFGFYQNINTIRINNRWKEAHAASASEPVPDLLKISGNVRIDPGKSLDMDLDLIFRAPKNNSIKNAIFTLNPGQKVKQASDSSGQPEKFTHENGLLKLILPDPLGPGKETSIHLTIQGLPDHGFGYLESTINTENLKSNQRDLSLLGLNRYIYDSRFVALMPGIRWLPASGTEKYRDDPRYRSTDFFNIDLTVDLPSGWLVAGPGRRHEIKGKPGRIKFRFSPVVPVPEVALIASKFKSLSFDTGGIKMELLVYPRHMRNIKFMADTGKKIKSWIEENLKELKEYGLDYPYGGLTLVEVPNSLRSFGGGWRMDTAMAPPGMLLMREMSFPMARFDWPFRNPDTFRNREGGITQAKWEGLQTFFINDVSGSNILSGTARNFFMDQVSVRGKEAIPLEFVMETLTSLLVTETGSYFSAHDFANDDGIGPLLGLIILSRDNGSLYKDKMINTAADMMASSSEVWENAGRKALSDMDPWDDTAHKMDVLTLKAGAMARCILDILGREKTAQFLSTLRKKYMDKSFTFEDMKASGKALGIDFGELFGDWLDSAALPGFLYSDVETYRLPDSKDGMPRYQFLISVRNDEPVPGIFRFRYQVGTGEKEKWIRTYPLLLKGKNAARYGIVFSRLPQSMWLEPYISLNQSSFMIPLRPPYPEKIINVEAIEGLKQIPWNPPDKSFFVIDDLDKGFTIMEDGKKKDVQKGTRAAGIGLNDKGLLSYTFYYVSPVWTRMDLPGSWGKYRHTSTFTKAGDGTKKAIFTTSIKKAGQWDLEIHMPDKHRSFPKMKFGKWNFVIKDSFGDRHEISFDSAAAFPGWNLSGSLNLPEGAVSVTLSNKTDGDLVLADAIRWSPALDK